MASVACLALGERCGRRGTGADPAGHAGFRQRHGHLDVVLGPFWVHVVVEHGDVVFAGFRVERSIEWWLTLVRKPRVGE